MMAIFEAHQHAQALQALTEVKALGQRIVSTNGCFDLLHVGHVRYLQFAKAQGDYLVVALNSDASVQGLKGPSRPIVPQADRAELLAALACVDMVVLFDEETPLALLEAMAPTVHVKGAQYTAETLPEAKALQALGTQLVFAPMVGQKSTTNVVQRIVALHTTP
jgi:rfaE bifunctional protein nucleotidyltransferase chain/domain